MHLALLQSSFNKPSSSTFGYAVDALAQRTDSPMVEEPRLPSDVQLAPNGLPHGLPIEHPSSGFTAVNGDVNKLPPINEQQRPWRPHSGRNSDGENITVSTSVRTSGWRPGVREEAAVLDERSKHPDDGTNKRKQSDLEADDQQALEGDDSMGHSNKRRQLPNLNIDSAIDLTSPDTEVERRPNVPGRSSREPSPIRNRGPLPPSSKVSAELHKSAMQFTQQVEPVAVEHDSPSNDDLESVDAQGPQGDQPQDDVGDGKKRKFANRTKTGCITCRKRKKKCDERKPTCLNCERGTFNCEGYGSKSSVGDIIRPGQHRPAQLQPSVKQYPEPQHHPQQPSWPPPQVDSNGKSYSHWGGKLTTPSEEVARLKDPYHPHHWHPGDLPPPPPHHAQPPPHVPPQHAPPMPGPYYHERTPSQYSNLPPPPPPQHMPPPMYNPPPHRQMSMTGPLPPPPGPPQEYWSSHPQGYHPYRHGPPHGFAHAAHSSVGGGLGNPNFPPKDLVEKNKMLRGEPYLHYKDGQLLNERKSCMEAVDRYNDALKPEKRCTQEEQVEYMIQILKPQRRGPKSSVPHTLWGPEGDTGSHTVIERPFKCDYGYHIHIGKQTIVSPNCYFQDGGGIHIGDRVIIGPNVLLSTINAPAGWELRKGSEGRLKAGPIWIGDDALIGARTTIEPFVHIGKGAVVGTGSVVTEDVADYTEVAGNPAIFLRRIDAKTEDNHKKALDQQEERGLKEMESYANSGSGWGRSESAWF